MTKINLERQSNEILPGKQDTLVSGTNIKTINGNSLLGSGDITISGGSGSPGGSDTQLQYNNAGAFGGIDTVTWDNTNKKLIANITSDKPVLEVKTNGNIVDVGALKLWDNTSDGFDKLISIGNGTTFTPHIELYASGYIDVVRDSGTAYDTHVMGKDTIAFNAGRMATGAGASSSLTGLFTASSAENDSNLYGFFANMGSTNVGGILLKGTGTTNTSEVGKHITIWGNTAGNSSKALSIGNGTTFTENFYITTDGKVGAGIWNGTAIADSYIASASTWNAKQDTLISGTNIKTINGSSLLGSGNITISGVGTGTANTIAYWDTTTSIASLATATYPSLTELSYVKSVTSPIQTQLDGKQTTLVSGTSIKTVNSTSLLGSGDIPVFPYTSEFTRLKEAPRKYWQFFSDMVQILSTTGTDKALRLFNSGTSAGTTELATTGNDRIGIARHATGTTATGRTAMRLSPSAIRFSGGTYYFETEVRVPTLSTSTERYAYVVGFADTETAANQVDGAYFLYDEGGVSTGSTAAAYWQTVTVSNSSRTFNTSLTQTTVTANQWYKLGIEVNAAGTSVAFYIDGTLVATHTATIPTASGRETSVMSLLIKSIGTTSRNVDVDYINAVAELTTAR